MSRSPRRSRSTRRHFAPKRTYPWSSRRENKMKETRTVIQYGSTSSSDKQHGDTSKSDYQCGIKATVWVPDEWRNIQQSISKPQKHTTEGKYILLQ